MRRLTLLALAAVVLAVGWQRAGRLDGALLPVVRDVEVILHSPPGQHASEVTVKLRNARNCRFLEMHWHRVTVSGSDIVHVSYGGGSAPSGNAVLGFGPTVIDMPSDDIVAHSFGEAIHRCHGFWLTRTRLH